MTTEYADALFDVLLRPASNFLAYIRPTVDFWPYIAIFKTYYMPIRPVATALAIMNIAFPRNAAELF